MILPPCPFCNTVQEIKLYKGYFASCSDGSLSVCCDKCGCTGPSAKDMQEAINMWGGKLKWQ